MPTDGTDRRVSLGAFALADLARLNEPGLPPLIPLEEQTAGDRLVSDAFESLRILAAEVGRLEHENRELRQRLAAHEEVER